MSANRAPAVAENSATYQPAPRDLILLDLPVAIKVSPSSRYVAIGVQTTNWLANRYETKCHLIDTEQGSTFPLNRTGSVQQIEWLDTQTLALLKEDDTDSDSGENTAQIWLYEGLVGDGWQVTEHERGVEWFAPFAKGFIYQANRPENKVDRQRAGDFGDFLHKEQETSKRALYYVGLAEVRAYQQQRRRTTAEEAKALCFPSVPLSRLLDAPLSIRDVIPCPTSTALYLNCWERDDLVHYQTASSYRLTFDASKLLAEYLQRKRTQGDGSPQRDRDEAAIAIHDLGEADCLPLPVGARVTGVAPDGKTLLIAHQGRDEKIYTRSDLWLLDLMAIQKAADATACLAQMRNISATLDRDVITPQWTEQGIFAAYVDGTTMRVARFHENGQVRPLDFGEIQIANAFHIGKDGAMAIVGSNTERFAEAYLVENANNAGEDDTIYACQQLSNFGQAIASWQVGTVETIRWQSKDGTEIEGVLRKPANFDPTKQYPLVFVVHGGPRGFADATLISRTDRMYYPAIQFANEEILVLHPNYRGSTGRGQAFTELNVNNLGVGDLWDLDSAIDHVVTLGWVDEQRIGCMGWSQGGYISAFAGLHSDRFCAVSVGAGISDWYTYHISNDIPYFTTDYLSGSPFHNREHYAPTAPMSNLANAKTPMLIQHGARDQRVPLSNAMELYRGLQAMNVPVELFIYPDMAHPITKPRENHAVMSQNLAWFCHYLLGKPLEM